MSRIVSSLPGRIRLRDPNLRDQTKLDALKKELSAMTVIRELQDNPRTGSILLHYDRNAIDGSAMETAIASVAEKIIGSSACPTALLSKKQINRYNKLIMLGSLGTSLGVAITRQKNWRRWHIWTGYLFAANLGVHLYIYRKSLLRLFR